MKIWGSSFFCKVLCVLLPHGAFALVDEEAQESRNIAIPAARDAQEFMDAFLTSLKSMDGTAAIERVKQRFPVDPAAGSTLGKKIDELLKTFGPIQTFECLGRIEPSESRRLASFVYLTHHESGPALWEVLVYQGTVRWQVLRMKFSTEDVLERLAAMGMTKIRSRTDGAE